MRGIQPILCPACGYRYTRRPSGICYQCAFKRGEITRRTFERAIKRDKEGDYEYDVPILQR